MEEEGINGGSGVSWKTLELVSAAYSFTVTVILWINAVRIPTTIAPNNIAPLLFTKFEHLVFYSQVAILQTVFFCASFSGILDRVLAEAAQLGLSSKFDAHFRKQCVFLKCDIFATSNVLFSQQSDVLISPVIG